MTPPPHAGRRPADSRTGETARRAKVHLAAASNMGDCAATSITRASELADERDGVGDELAQDIAALRSSACLLIDVLRP